MDDNIFDNLFSGDFENLIELPKRIVRLFISSTFTDMTLERNSLMEHVYPRLKKYCRERYGLDFQVVDMRWGVRDEATDDHQTASLCSREIDNCKRMSLGPNFVALIGDKYGFRPLCNRIRSNEYRAIRHSLIQLDINTDFLDAWYKEDQNAIPAEFVLQPISSILKNFANKAEPDLQSVDQHIWQAIQERLHQLLLIGSSQLVRLGRMDPQEQLMKYSISVTEREVIEGCLGEREPRNHCLVYVRSIVDLRDRLNDCLSSLVPSSINQLALAANSSINNQSNLTQSSGGQMTDSRRDSQTRRASLKIGDDVISLTTSGAQNAVERKLERQRRQIAKYLDLKSKDNMWQVDQEAQSALAKLRDEKIELKLRSDRRNLTKFKISWHEQDGMSMKCEEHKHYLSELTEHFYSNLTRLIKKASKQEQSFKSGLVGEVLQHLLYATHVSKSFHGRDEELKIIFSYVLNKQAENSSENLKPMFIYGVGGSGKTSCLAKFVTLAFDRILRDKRSTEGSGEPINWSERPCVIARFCCTTPKSSSMVDVLSSVCRQLQFNFYQYGPLNGASGQNVTLLKRRDNTSMGNTFDESTSAELNTDERETLEADQLPYRPVPEDFVQLVFALRQLIDNCRHQYHCKRLFVIVLDSVERLSSASESNVEVKYSWLTSIGKLPPNVRLIVSCSSEKSNKLEYRDYVYLKRHFLRTYLILSKQNTNNLHTEQLSMQQATREKIWILHLKPLGLNLALEVIDSWLRRVKRKLSQQQWALVRKSFSHTSRPIFVKLAFGELVNWKSYSRQSDAKGLTFGSSLLKARRRQASTFIESSLVHDSKLSQLVEQSDYELEDEENQSDYLKLQVLAMEQEWSNYLDYNQRKRQIVSSSEQPHAPEAGTGKRDEGALMIRLDTVGAQRAGSSSSSGLLSANVCHLLDNIDDAIFQLFGRIESQHGFVLTKHSLSYITAARNGIGENELEDILSLDDVVLDDVFQYHLPPVRRIPPLLWTRIRNDLPDYLSERDADGIVINWHHGQFSEATKRRYLIDREQVVYIHSIMADYFLGRWADKPKQFRCTKQQIQMALEQLDSAVQQSLRESQSVGRDSGGGQQRNSLTGQSGSFRSQQMGSASARETSFMVRNRNRGSDMHERLQWMQAKADRRVPHQPLYYLQTSSIALSQEDNETTKLNKIPEVSVGEGKLPSGVCMTPTRRYNLRKLTELPYHLVRASRFHELLSNCLLNYQWLFATLDSIGLQSLLGDFEDAITALDAARRRLEPDSSRLADSQRQQHTPMRLTHQMRTNELIELELRSISRVEELSGDVMLDMVQQLGRMRDTMRLSSSALHSDPQMLAPQLLGRLLSWPRSVTLKNPSRGQPLASNNSNYLGQLLEQCDKEGSLECALLPIERYLQSPDGIQSSSLEGHSFAISSMAMGADQRHLMAVSNKFIMWDTSTGRISRDVDPKIDGSIMRKLEIGYNNEFAISFTSDNQILLLATFTQQVSKCNLLATHDDEPGVIFAPAVSATNSIRGLKLIDEFGGTKFVVWTETSCFVFQVVREESQLKKVSNSATSTCHLKLQYQLHLNAFEGVSNGTIIAIQAVELNNVDPYRADLLFIQHYQPKSNLIELLTIRAWTQGSETAWDFELWPQKIEAQSLALDKHSRQLGFVDERGDLYLRRRRANCWSRKKLLRKASLAVVAQEGKSTSGEQLLLEASDKLALSMELHLPRLSRGELEALVLRNDGLERDQLVDFERKIDNIGDQDEIEATPVFERTNSTYFESKNRQKRENIIPVTGTELISVFFKSKILIQRLVTSKAGGRILMLPKNLQNIPIEPNQSHVKSAILNLEFLIVAANRQILFYHIDNEQLLASLKAHNSRIVQLLPVYSSIPDQNLNPMGDPMSGLSVASASIDKTVKIWQLSNVGKGSAQDDLGLEKLDEAIESLKVASSQKPIASGLARGELALWNWQNLRSIERFGPKASSKRECKFESKIEATCFSSNGQLLCLASGDLLQVFSFETINNLQASRLVATAKPNAKITSANEASSQKPKKLECEPLDLKPTFKITWRDVLSLDLRSSLMVRKLKFLLQDSRLLCILEEKQLEPALAVDFSTPPEVSQGAATSASGVFSGHDQSSKVLVVCLSVPDGKLLYTIQYETPKLLSGGGGTTSTVNNSGRSLSKASESSLVNQQAVRCASRIRLPVVTLDRQFLVCVCLKLHQFTTAFEDSPALPRSSPSPKLQAVSRGPNEQTIPDRKRKCGELSLTLDIYTTREGLLVRSLNLNRLELSPVSDSIQIAGEQLASRRQLVRNFQTQLQPNASKSANENSDLSSSSSISIGSNQFNRLKAVLYRERLTIVALIDDESGSSYLIDVSSGQLMAYSSLWSGKVSSDGRFGLSWMFKSVQALRSSSLSSVERRFSSQIEPSAMGANQQAAGTLEGLQLLEMRRLSPLKGLLPLQTIARLVAGERQLTSASDRDINYNFTKPNDDYIYYHDSRLARLLLIRVRDSQLIANYKLSGTLTKIKSSPDGLALVLAFADGSLSSLAIVDPEKSDTLLRLSQYPSRRRT